VYVRPSDKRGYGAVIWSWVTKTKIDAGFGDEFYARTQLWVKESWPFEEVAYPVQSIVWTARDKL
jgi:hypothetical protein